MTVYIEKPAVNLREELASLRNQGGYQEQQFYFDGLVTNGTFDTDTTGWTEGNTGPTSSVASGQVTISLTSSTRSEFSQIITTVVGKTYSCTFDLISETGTASAQVWIGTTRNNASMANSGGISAGSATLTFTATTTATYVTLSTSGVSGDTSTWDNVSVFETDGTDVVHRLPKGWKPKDVFEDGLVQREGAAHDYEVVYDGFDYYVKPAVAPSATTQTCVIGVKA